MHLFNRFNLILLPFILVVGSLPLLSFTEAGYQMNVTCASGGWSLKPTLTWRAKGGREIRNSVDHYKTGLYRYKNCTLCSKFKNLWSQTNHQHCNWNNCSFKSS